MAVPGVALPRVVMPRIRRAVLVIMSRIKSWIAGMDRMVIAERDAFEIARRAADVFGLTESDVVRCLAFEDEVCRLFRR